MCYKLYVHVMKAKAFKRLRKEGRSLVSLLFTACSSMPHLEYKFCMSTYILSTQYIIQRQGL